MRLLLLLIALIVGPIAYLAYSGLVNYDDNFSLSLIRQKNNIAIIAATFSFTLLGFLAAIITILFSFISSHYFKQYNKKGYLDIFFFLYFVTIVSLVMTFFASILSLSNFDTPWIMRITLMSMINNVVQVAALTIIIINITRQIMEENAKKDTPGIKPIT